MTERAEFGIDDPTDALGVDVEFVCPLCGSVGTVLWNEPATPKAVQGRCFSCAHRWTRERPND